MARPTTGRDRVLTARVDETTLRVVQDRAKDSGKSTSETANDLIRAALAADDRDALEAQRKGLGVEGYAWLVDHYATNARRIIHDLAETNPLAARALATGLVAADAAFAVEAGRATDEWIGANLTKRAKKS